MKYIAYWELDQQNMDAAVQKVNQIMQIIDKNPNKSTKVLFPHMLLEIGYTGFTILESDDPSAIGAVLVMASPEVKINIVPIYDAMEALEKYQSVRSMMPRTTTAEASREQFEKTLNV
jgi:hypothetical protein